MIVIKAILDNDCLRPETSLSVEQIETVTSVLSNGNDFIYYQGDEPQITE